MDVLWLVLVGFVAGAVSILFGVGGGIIVVPALLWLKGFDVKLAVATSLAMIVPTAIVAVWRHPVRADFRVAAFLAAGAVGGAFLGEWVVGAVSSAWIKRGFAVLLAAVSIKLFLEA